MTNNIKLTYFYTFFSNIGVTSLWVLYLAHKGMGLVEIGLLESIFHIASFIFETPTGIMADTYGRKKAIIAGRIASLASALIMLFANSFALFALGFVVSALSYNLQSGSGEALLYDSLKQNDEEHRYLKISSHLNFLLEVAACSGILLAGFLSDLNFAFTYVVAIVLAIISLATASKFIEPTIHETTEKVSLLATTKSALLFLRKDKSLFFIMVCFAVYLAFQTSFGFYFQNYYKTFGLTNAAISIVLFVSGLLQAITSMAIPFMEKHLGSKRIFYIISIASSFFVLIAAIMSNIFVIIVFSVLCFILASTFYPLQSNFLHKRIPSEERATLISFASMFFSLTMIVLFPVMGLLGDWFGLQYVFIGSSVLLTFLTLAVALIGIKNKK